MERSLKLTTLRSTAMKSLRKPYLILMSREHDLGTDTDSGSPAGDPCAYSKNGASKPNQTKGHF
jgi:hypothetical protein